MAVGGVDRVVVEESRSTGWRLKNRETDRVPDADGCRLGAGLPTYMERRETRPRKSGFSRPLPPPFRLPGWRRAFCAAWRAEHAIWCVASSGRGGGGQVLGGGPIGFWEADGFFGHGIYALDGEEGGRYASVGVLWCCGVDDGVGVVGVTSSHHLILHPSTLSSSIHSPSP